MASPTRGSQVPPPDRPRLERIGPVTDPRGGDPSAGDLTYLNVAQVATVDSRTPVLSLDCRNPGDDRAGLGIEAATDAAAAPAPERHPPAARMEVGEGAGGKARIGATDHRPPSVRPIHRLAARAPHRVDVAERLMDGLVAEAAE